ncbi:MAG: hypothetical protein PF486_07850 [Prolixibacteraceae bacterium]|jgi:hypothetical protein|nr:hypothetical protein [Prolixibacteraceae bacterium]
MGGEGSIRAMQVSLKNNRNLLRKFSPLRAREKYLKAYKIKLKETKKPTEAQLAQLRQKLMLERKREIRLTIIVFVIAIVIVGGVAWWIIQNSIGFWM